MRQLRSCDFCGDDAVGAFEVVPPELNPSEAEQRRVVLCGACRDRLDELLEPLLTRLDVSDAADASDDEAVTSSDREASATDGGGVDTASQNANTGSQTENTGSQNAATTAHDATADAGGTDSAGATARGRDGTDAVGDQGGITLEGGADEERAEAADADATDDAESGSGSGSGSGSASASGSTNGRTSSQAPPAYGKAMRLLRNREFPMPRREVESLIAGAYDLEDPEVEKIVDHAIEMGRLADDGGTIRRA